VSKLKQNISKIELKTTDKERLPPACTNKPAAHHANADDEIDKIRQLSLLASGARNELLNANKMLLDYDIKIKEKEDNLLASQEIDPKTLYKNPVQLMKKYICDIACSIMAITQFCSRIHYIVGNYIILLYSIMKSVGDCFMYICHSISFVFIDHTLVNDIPEIPV
jgi:hypothetical protein